MFKKVILYLILSLPFVVYSQDTLFSKNLTNITVRSAGKKNTEVAVITTIRNSSVVSDGVSIEFIKKTPDRNVGEHLKE